VKRKKNVWICSKNVASSSECHVAILWLQQFGISNVDFELDCKLVVDSIVDRTNNLAEFGNIISTCKSLLSQFSNFKISFVRGQ